MEDDNEEYQSLHEGLLGLDKRPQPETLEVTDPKPQSCKAQKARAYALQQALNGTWSRFGRHFHAVVSHGLHSSSFFVVYI